MTQQARYQLISIKRYQLISIKHLWPSVIHICETHPCILENTDRKITIISLIHLLKVRWGSELSIRTTHWHDSLPFKNRTQKSNCTLKAAVRWCCDRKKIPQFFQRQQKKYIFFTVFLKTAKKEKDFWRFPKSVEKFNLSF